MKTKEKKKIKGMLIGLEVIAFAGIIILIILLTGGKPKDNVPLKDIKDAVFSKISDTSAFKESDAMGLKKYYGIDAAELSEFCLYLPASNMDAAELLIVVANEESQIDSIRKACETRLANQKGIFESYGVDQMELLNNAHIISDSRYLAYIVCRDSNNAAAAFNKSIH